ncbi:unnamed protein product [Symbiodinium sp. CCMP2592]|nr:unnamed protein product [Symbiodinium sp. CCMP2592]
MSSMPGELDVSFMAELEEVIDAAAAAGAEDPKMEEGANSDASSGSGASSKRSFKRGRRSTGSRSTAPSAKVKPAKKIAGVRKQTKANCRKCKGCGLFFRPEDMGSRSPYCVKDKTRVDNLTRLAKQLGRSAWFASIKADESKLPHALKTYRDLTGDDGEGSKKKVPKGVLFQSMEKSVAGSRVSHDAEYKYMPEDLYTKHVTEVITEQEGRLTGAQAAAQWSKWKALIEEDPDTQEIIYDKKGKDGALRVAVPISDIVRLSNFQEDLKEFGQVRTEKNLDEAAQEARRKDIVANHNSEDAICRASKLARSGAGGNAFIGKTFDFDFEALMKSMADEDEQKDEEGDGSEKASSQPSTSGKGGLDKDKDSDISPSKPKGKKRGKDEEGAPKPGKKAKQWDKETVVASRIRSENTALCTLEVQLTQRLGECREVLATLQSKGQDCSEEAKVEKVTLEKRTMFLAAIMGTSGEKLKALIGEYDRQAPAQAIEKSTPPAPTVVTSWEAQLETSPPCESFRELTTLASWKDSVESLWSASSAAELRDLSKTRCTQRRPILELSQACKTGVKELQKAMTAFDARKKQKAEGVRPSAKKGAAAGSALWETGLEVAMAVPEVTCASDEVDFSMPTLFKLAKPQLDTLATDSLKAAGDQFATARAACKMQAEAAAVWSSFVGYLPKMLENVEGCECGPFHVGVQGGNVATASEADYMASIRVATQGSRTVIAIPMSLASHVFGNHEPTVLWSRFMNASVQEINQLAEGRHGRQMFAITHGVGDVLYLPAAWIFAEKVNAQNDMLGMLARGLVLKDHQAITELGLVFKLLSASKTAATEALKPKLEMMERMLSDYIKIQREMAAAEALIRDKDNANADADANGGGEGEDDSTKAPAPAPTKAAETETDEAAKPDEAIPQDLPKEEVQEVPNVLPPVVPTEDSESGREAAPGQVIDVEKVQEPIEIK